MKPEKIENTIEILKNNGYEITIDIFSIEHEDIYNVFIELFEYEICLSMSTENNYYNLSTCRQGKEEWKNEKDVKTIKGIIGYINKFDK